MLLNSWLAGPSIITMDKEGSVEENNQSSESTV